MIKMLSRFFFLVFVVLIVALFVAYYYFSRQLPLSGQLDLAGLKAPVTLQQESSGVMHVKAANAHDMWFAQGFIHARERLWQMEVNRHTSSGRLAELFGEQALAKDKFLRTLGIQHYARQAVAHLSPEIRAAIQAYVDGINAFIASDPPLSPEFTLFNYTPSPWQISEVLAWQKVMAFHLADNRKKELVRYRLLAQGLSLARIEQLIPSYSEDGTEQFSTAANVATPDPKTATQAAELLTLFESYFPVSTQASNNWVVHGKRTASGQPFLANDPHLGINTPSTWYLMHLQGGAYDVIGSSMAGLPGIAIGHNANIAWGITNMVADVEDLYWLEPSADGAGYLYQGETRAYQTRAEVIQVKGGDPYTLTVRESVYGPVLSDVLSGSDAKPLALRWVGHTAQDTTLEAFLRINRAQNWREFRDIIATYYYVPVLNFVYADTQGNIGYQMAGRIPIRQPQHQGIRPRPGTGEWDWQGFIPFAELVSILNPEQGYFFTANHRVTPPDYPYLVSRDWLHDPFRARRLQQLLAPLQNANIADMERIQLDTVSLLFHDFKPLLAQLKPSTPAAQVALQQLLAWEGNAHLSSRASTLFHAWYIAFSRLPQAETQTTYWYEYPRYLINALRSGDAACTQRKLSCIDFATQQFETVVADLGEPIPMWGEYHIGVFKHMPLSETPLALLAERRAAVPGGRYTLNVGWYKPDNFEVVHAPGYRQLIDLADFNQSRFILTPGQAGHLLDPHYDSLLLPWRDGHYLLMRTSDYPVYQTLTLQPADTN